ncbi:MAG: hypothetical protein WCR54_04470 [Clostridia bacterium]
MATTKEITDFLTIVKSADTLLIVKTDKNRETRYRLGITIDDQKNIIKGLTAQNYIKGPIPDYDPTKLEDIWIFKSYKYNNTFYIKLKIITKNKAKALSCHIDNIEI